MAATKICKNLEIDITFGIIESSTVMVSAHRFSHVVDVMDVPNVR